jgi:HPt (histidine-containing phosphotransfer) domain-containing protein
LPEGREPVALAATSAPSLDQGQDDLADIDVLVLQDLASLSKDATFVERLTEGYLSDLRRLLHEISDALQLQDYAAVRDTAHALKGGSASVGAHRLAAIGAKFNDASDQALQERGEAWRLELNEAATVATGKLQQYIATRARRRSMQG